MINNLFSKELVVGIIVLFVGASVAQSTVNLEKTTMNRKILYVGGGNL
jgi:hypothetical protein